MLDVTLEDVIASLDMAIRAITFPSTHAQPFHVRGSRRYTSPLPSVSSPVKP